jgi:uncharacterized protein (DUF302 family)
MDINKDIVTHIIKKADFNEILETLTKEAQLRNYRVVKIVNVDRIKERASIISGLNIGFDHYKIIEICNLMNCNEIVSSDLRAGVFMPIRLAVYQPKNKNEIHISYFKPTAFVALFKSTAMMKVAKQLESDLDEVAKAADF